MSSRTRRRLRILAGLLLVGPILLLLAPTIAGRLVRWRLQAMVSGQLDARLNIGGLVYHAPYGVSVTDASLVTKGPDGAPLELLRMPHLELELARSPFARGPLLIQSFVISDAAVHLIRTRTGIVGRRVLAISDSTATASHARLSELFRLRHFAIQGGRVVYDDQTRPNAVPLVWSNINIDLDTSQQSDSGYGYHLVVNNAPLATLDTAGTFDIDELLLRVDRCGLLVSVDPAQRASALSAELQTPLRNWQARGTLAIDAAGTLPLRDTSHGTYRSTIELKDASATVPGWQTTLDRVGLKLQIGDGEPATPGRPHTMKLLQLNAAAGDVALRVQDAQVIADRQSNTWKLSGLSGHIDIGSARATLPTGIKTALERLHAHGAIDFALDAQGLIGAADLKQYTARLELTPQDLSLQPPGFSETIGGIQPVVVELADDVLTLNGVRGACGDNLVYLKRARVSLADFPNRIHADELAGCITFGPHQVYPAFIPPRVTACKPVGPFFFSGSIECDADKPMDKLDYRLRVQTTRGRVVVTDHQIPVTNIDTVIDVTPTAAVISRFEAATLDGSASLSGRVELSGRTPYQIKATLRDIDLRELGRYLAVPGQAAPPLSGRGVLEAQLNGDVPEGKTPAYMGLTGDGEFEVLGGDFWRVPVMQSIADSVSVKQATTVGEAAGQFHVHRGTIHFDRAVASAPALGVEGSGDVGFDGPLNLTLIANVLGNWGDRAGNVDDGGVSKLLDKVQKGVNTATRVALYEVQVSGSADRPVTKVVPAPFITRQATRLLGAAADKGRKSGLLKTLHEDDASAGKSQ